MTKDEALRLALEALSYINEGANNQGAHTGISWRCAANKSAEALNAIKAALEAKDEPVATKNNDGVTLHLGWDNLPVGTKLYATPPQRTWVGLTDEEIDAIYEQHHNQYGECESANLGYERAIEAKLKQKNEQQTQQ